MKTYFIQFGSGNPSSKIGLSPTLITFVGVLPNFGITAPLVAAPGVSELPTRGIYCFQYEPQASMGIVFVCDGGATLSPAERYVLGNIDPLDALDEKLGFPNDSYGDSLSDPSTLFGYEKRALEDAEGNGAFDASTNKWSILSRGSSTLLATKTMANNAGDISKT